MLLRHFSGDALHVILKAVNAVFATIDRAITASRINIKPPKTMPMETVTLLAVPNVAKWVASRTKLALGITAKANIIAMNERQSRALII